MVHAAAIPTSGLVSNCMLLSRQAIRLFQAELHAVAYLISNNYLLEDSTYRSFLILCIGIRRLLLVACRGKGRGYLGLKAVSR